MAATMLARLAFCLILLLAAAPRAETTREEIGPWRLSCHADPMTDRTSCVLAHRDPVERAAVGPALSFEIIDRGGQLLPAVTARDLSFDSAARLLFALGGVAQIRYDRQPMMELPCGLEGRHLVCAPRGADAARAAAELPVAERVLVRMSGLLPGGASPADPVELRLAETRTAMERFRRLQPAGGGAPPPGLDLRDLLGRLPRWMP